MNYGDWKTLFYLKGGPTDSAMHAALTLCQQWQVWRSDKIIAAAYRIDGMSHDESIDVQLASIETDIKNSK